MTTSIAYQPTDLQRRGREILDEGRSQVGGALIRDKDGELLTVIPKDSIDRRDRVIELSLAAQSASFGLVSGVPHLVVDAPLSWVALLRPVDQKTFLGELMSELRMVVSGSSLDRLEDLVHDWRVTAELMQDEALVEELTSDLDGPLGREL